MNDLQKLISFVRFTHAFQSVERKVFVTGMDRNENDAEHSCQLALTAWYIASSNKLSFDMAKILKYALAHDLVEAYAGDVPAYNLTPEIKKEKAEKEKAALKRISQEFPDAEDMLTIIKQYEERADDEAKFVYALDKVLPMLNVYIDNGRSWKRDSATLDIVRELTERTAISPDIYPYWQELQKLLEEKEGGLFHSNQRTNKLPTTEQA